MYYIKNYIYYNMSEYKGRVIQANDNVLLCNITVDFLPD